MNVLSLFDGMSCGQIALKNLGIPYDKYYASEVNVNALRVTQHNFPNTIQVGDVTVLDGSLLGPIDLLIGGSPCQGFSFAGKQLAFRDERSKLFFEFVRIKRETNPKYFLLENVKMKKKFQDVITEFLGVEPIEIDSALVSAQNRKRLYWTNIPNITLPEDKGVILGDILDEEVAPRYYLSEKAIGYMGRLRNGKPRWYYHKNPVDGKSACLTANMWKGVPYGVIESLLRRLTPSECARLQTIPDWYDMSVISPTAQYELLGNGWTVDVISHILKNLNFN